MRSRRFVLPAIIAGLALLTGCAPQAAAPSASPTKTAAAPSATPTPTPADAVASRVVVHSQTVDVVAEDGSTIASVRYFDPATDMVAALTKAFKAEPVVTPDAGGNETPSGTRYTWGGFAIVDRDVEQAEPYSPALAAFWDTADVNGVRVETVDGIAVGDAAEPLAEGHPDGLFRNPNNGELSVRVDVALLPLNADYGDKPSFAVALVGVTDGPVARMIAPSGNWGV
ncbi:hypothetical protein [Plantibacter sp. YIM 135249]|uniref:hypothetical protein n=1 Tax=Plantibacter sp. YIM 135249 TaxID=3423918 RepID=UPI003D325125